MIKGGQDVLDTDFTLSAQAGEALSANDAVYIGSDGKAYKTKGDDMTKINFKGFVRENTSSGAIAYIVHGRQATGFTGLTAGSLYYMSATAGAISTTPSTFKKAIGEAIGTTVIKIIDVPYTRIVKFTSSGTWTKYQGLKEADIIAVGGGGGGGRWSSSNNNNQAAGGGGAGYAEKFAVASELGSTETITVGSGGAGQTGAPAAGDGTASSFGSLVVAQGGGGADQLTPGAGNPGTTGDILRKGTSGEFWTASSSYGGAGIMGRGGRSPYSPYGDGGMGGEDVGAATDGEAGQNGIVIVIEKY